MKSEKIEVTQRPATEADIADFHRGDFQEFRNDMLGQQVQQGSRYDFYDTGYGSGVHQAMPTRLNPPEDNVVINPQEPTTNLPYQPDETDHWKKLYGDSENAKGELRREIAARDAQLAQINAELAALRVAQNASSTGYTRQSVPTAAQPAAPIPDTFFPGKTKEELVEVGEVDSMLTTVAIAFQQQQQALQALQAAQLGAQKHAVGITPAVEQKLVSENPWLSNMPEGLAKVQAMQTLINRQAQQEAGPQPAPRSAQVNPAQAAARRVTYIESGNAPSAAQGEGVPLQQRVAQELAEARAKGGANAMRAVLMKYGMQQVNDWGPDMWGPVR